MWCEGAKMFPCDDKAAYRRWSNLKVPVIAHKVEACILRCMWLVHLNPKAELTNEKEKLPLESFGQERKVKPLAFSTDCTNWQCRFGMVCPDRKWIEQTSRN